jgi:hypothetical protein
MRARLARLAALSLTCTLAAGAFGALLVGGCGGLAADALWGYADRRER